MSFQLNLDQHRLISTKDGAIVVGEKNFNIYDLLSKRLVELPINLLDSVVSFLAAKPAVVMSTSEAPQDAVLSSEAQQASSAPSCVQSLDEPPHASVSSPPSAASEEIWVKNSGKPSATDLQARNDLIKLIKSYKFHKLLNDKKTTKKSVFEEIATEMLKKGYAFGEREAWKVFKQKWANMEAETLRVLAAAGPKNSGGGQVKKPEYFDDVFDIVKDTAKACPKNIQDSIPTKDVVDNDKKAESSSPFDDEEEVNPSSEESSSPFLKVKTSSKPDKKRVNSNEILSFLKEDAAKRDKQNEKLLSFFTKKAKKDDKHKRAFLSVLQDLAGTKKKKKSSEEEDSTSSSAED